MQEIQGPVVGTPFEMASPNQQRQSFCRAPSVVVEARRALKAINVATCIFQGLDGALDLPDVGVHGNGHVDDCFVVACLTRQTSKATPQPI